MIKKILVVEDDLTTSKAVKFLLNQYYKVHTVANGSEALAWLNKNKKADLVLTDLDMPEMTGKQLIEALDTSFSFDQIPVVVMSSDCLEFKEDAERYLNVFGCLKKPVIPSELFLQIERAFSASQN